MYHTNAINISISVSPIQISKLDLININIVDNVTPSIVYAIAISNLYSGFVKIVEINARGIVNKIPSIKLTIKALRSSSLFSRTFSLPTIPHLLPRFIIWTCNTYQRVFNYLNAVFLVSGLF